MSENKTYHLCHVCQLKGMRNCSEFDSCGGDKEYPTELRQMVEELHNAKYPISIIAEKAFDMGQKHKNYETKN